MQGIDCLWFIVAGRKFKHCRHPDMANGSKEAEYSLFEKSDEKEAKILIKYLKPKLCPALTEEKLRDLFEVFNLCDEGQIKCTHIGPSMTRVSFESKLTCNRAFVHLTDIFEDYYVKGDRVVAVIKQWKEPFNCGSKT